MIILNEAFLNPKIFKNPLVVAFQEKTTIIDEYLGLKYVRTGQGMVDNLQMRPRSVRKPFPSASATDTHRNGCSSWKLQLVRLLLP